LIRILTSINWVIGTLALIAALAYPFVNQYLVVPVTQAVGKGIVDQIAKEQREHFVRFEKYIYFPPSGPVFEKAMRALNRTELDPDFDIEAYADDENSLVIRATTAPSLLRKGWVGPMVYEYKIRVPGDTGSGEWQFISASKPGLI